MVRGCEKGRKEKDWSKKGCASAAGRLTLHVTTALISVYLCQDSSRVGRIDPTTDFSTII